MRICSECKKKMYEGYCIENGTEYYCSDECLHKHYNEEEYLEMYDDGEGDSYYTEWYDEIEYNEIICNELPIVNLGQLSYSIYQDEYLIEDENKANECIKYLLDNLKKVYDLIDTLDEGEYFENKDNKVSKMRHAIDLYQVGDIINFIETIKIKKVGRE